jgi:MFS family permease
LRTAVAAVWAVIVSTLFLQTANGLQTDLISLRADTEGFRSAVIGAVMASYYVGYSLAPFAGRAVIARIGHVWTIAGCALAASVVIVVQPYLITVPVWTGLRVASGFVLSLSYVAYESWINDRVPNAQRGRVFSIYMFAQMVGMTGAQYLLTFGEAKSTSLFILAGLLFVVAALPVMAARHTAPAGAPPEPLGVLSLFRLSPLGAGATVLAGLSWAIMFTFGPVYARRVGFDVPSIGLFMGFAMAVGGALQIPLGWLSDIAGRRPVIALMFVAGLLASLFGVWAVDRGETMHLIAMAIAGGFAFPIYAISVAHVNDGIGAETRVAAAAGLVLLFGIGSFFGPLLCGPVMSAAGAGGFFVLLAMTMGAGAILTALRR